VQTLNRLFADDDGTRGAQLPSIRPAAERAWDGPVYQPREARPPFQIPARVPQTRRASNSDNKPQPNTQSETPTAPHSRDQQIVEALRSNPNVNTDRVGGPLSAPQQGATIKWGYFDNKLYALDVTNNQWVVQGQSGATYESVKLPDGTWGAAVTKRDGSTKTLGKRADGTVGEVSVQARQQQPNASSELRPTVPTVLPPISSNPILNPGAMPQIAPIVAPEIPGAKPSPPFIVSPLFGSSAKDQAFSSAVGGDLFEGLRSNSVVRLNGVDVNLFSAGETFGKAAAISTVISKLPGPAQAVYLVGGTAYASAKGAWEASIAQVEAGGPLYPIEIGTNGEVSFSADGMLSMTGRAVSAIPLAQELSDVFNMLIGVQPVNLATGVPRSPEQIGGSLGQILLMGGTKPGVLKKAQSGKPLSVAPPQNSSVPFKRNEFLGASARSSVRPGGGGGRAALKQPQALKQAPHTAPQTSTPTTPQNPGPQVSALLTVPSGPKQPQSPPIQLPITPPKDMEIPGGGPIAQPLIRTRQNQVPDEQKVGPGGIRPQRKLEPQPPPEVRPPSNQGSEKTPQAIGTDPSGQKTDQDVDKPSSPANSSGSSKEIKGRKNVGKTPELFKSDGTLNEFGEAIAAQQRDRMRADGSRQPEVITAAEAASGRYTLVDAEFAKANTQYWVWRDAYTFADPKKGTAAAGYEPVVPGRINNGHIVDAALLQKMSYMFGQKSDLVTAMMEQLSNYRFENDSINKSRGAQTGLRYKVSGEKYDKTAGSDAAAAAGLAAFINHMQGRNTSSDLSQTELDSLLNKVQTAIDRANLNGKTPYADLASLSPYANIAEASASKKQWTDLSADALQKKLIENGGRVLSDGDVLAIIANPNYDSVAQKLASESAKPSDQGRLKNTLMFTTKDGDVVRADSMQQGAEQIGEKVVERYYGGLKGAARETLEKMRENIDLSKPGNKRWWAATAAAFMTRFASTGGDIGLSIMAAKNIPFPAPIGASDVAKRRAATQSEKEALESMQAYMKRRGEGPPPDLVEKIQQAIESKVGQRPTEQQALKIIDVVKKTGDPNSLLTVIDETIKAYKVLTQKASPAAAIESAISLAIESVKQIYKVSSTSPLSELTLASTSNQPMGPLAGGVVAATGYNSSEVGQSIFSPANVDGTPIFTGGGAPNERIASAFVGDRAPLPELGNELDVRLDEPVLEGQSDKGYIAGRENFSLGFEQPRSGALRDASRSLPTDPQQKIESLYAGLERDGFADDPRALGAVNDLVSEVLTQARGTRAEATAKNIAKQQKNFDQTIGRLAGLAQGALPAKYKPLVADVKALANALLVPSDRVGGNTDKIIVSAGNTVGDLVGGNAGAAIKTGVATFGAASGAGNLAAGLGQQALIASTPTEQAQLRSAETGARQLQGDATVEGVIRTVAAGLPDGTAKTLLTSVADIYGVSSAKGRGAAEAGRNGAITEDPAAAQALLNSVGQLRQEQEIVTIAGGLRAAAGLLPAGTPGNGLLTQAAAAYEQAATYGSQASTAGKAAELETDPAKKQALLANVAALREQQKDATITGGLKTLLELVPAGPTKTVIANAITAYTGATQAGTQAALAGQEKLTLQGALASEPNEMARRGIQGQIDVLDKKEKQLRETQGQITRSAIFDGVGQLIGDNPVGKVVGQIDEIINVANKTTTDGVTGNAGFAIGGAAATAVAGAINNPALGGLGAVLTGVNSSMVAGTEGAKFGQLAQAEVNKGPGQNNQQIIDFYQGKEAQARAVQAGATWSIVGTGLNTIATVTGSKEIAIAGEVATGVGSVLPLTKDGIAGNGAVAGVTAGLQLAGKFIPGTVGKIASAVGGATQAVTQIVKGGLSNVAGGIGTIASLAGNLIGGTAGKILDWGGAIATAIANPIMGGLALAKKLADALNIFGTRKGKMGDHAQDQLIDLNKDGILDKVERDNDNDIKVFQGSMPVVALDVAGLKAKGELRGDTITDGLATGQVMASANGKYATTLMEDGNLVVFEAQEDSSLKAIWASGAPIKGGAVMVQPDGKLVGYQAAAGGGQAVWQTPGAAGGNEPHFLMMQDDGNLVMYRGTSIADQKGAVWSSKGSANIENVMPTSFERVAKFNHKGFFDKASQAKDFALEDLNADGKIDLRFKDNQYLNRSTDGGRVTFVDGAAEGAANAQAAAKAKAEAGALLPGIYAVYEAGENGEGVSFYDANGRPARTPGSVVFEDSRASGWIGVDQGNGQIARVALATIQRSSARSGGSVKIKPVNSQLASPTVGGPAGALANPLQTSVARGIDPAAANALVVQAYREVLNREPDEGGLTNWTNAVVAGNFDKVSLYKAFRDSQEGQTGVTTLVTQAYRDVLGREPDTKGLADWSASVASGNLNKTTLYQAFRDSAELKARAGELAGKAYQDVLGRVADPGGLASATQVLQTGGQTIAEFRTGLAASNEAKVNKAYKDFFGTGPDPAGLQYWWNLMQSGQLNETQLRDSFAQIAAQQKAA
jgi:hypothetical protein